MFHRLGRLFNPPTAVFILPVPHRQARRVSSRRQGFASSRAGQTDKQCSVTYNQSKPRVTLEHGRDVPIL